MISAGMPHFTQGYTAAGNFMPSPASASFRKFSQPQPDFRVQNSTNMSEPSGSRLFETMKSSMLWMSPMPGSCTSAHTL